MNRRWRPRLCSKGQAGTTGLAVVAVLAGLMAACGCNVVGMAMYKLSGPPSIAALYIPKQQPTLVLVENYELPVASAADAETLGRYIAEELKSRKVVPVIDQQKLYELRMNRGAAYRGMAITAVGRELGAAQVLYVHLEQAAVSMTPGSETLQGTVSGRVRFIDVATGETLWPTADARGYTMGYQTPMPAQREHPGHPQVRQQMLTGMAERVVMLFRKWKPDDLQQESIED